MTEEVRCTTAECAEGQYEFYSCIKRVSAGEASYTYTERQTNPCGINGYRYTKPANCNSGIPNKCSDGSDVTIINYPNAHPKMFIKQCGVSEF